MKEERTRHAALDLKPFAKHNPLYIPRVLLPLDMHLLWYHLLTVVMVMFLCTVFLAGYPQDCTLTFETEADVTIPQGSTVSLIMSSDVIADGRLICIPANMQESFGYPFGSRQQQEGDYTKASSSI